MSKRASLGMGAALLGAMLWPARQNWRPREHRTDGFPLSYYPMFTAQRKQTGTVVHLVGIDATGRRRVLLYSHAGTGGLNQVRRQLRKAVATGRAEQVARTVAHSVGRRGTRGVCEVRVVSGTYRYDEFFAGQPGCVRETVHASASVPGS